MGDNHCGCDSTCRAFKITKQAVLESKRKAMFEELGPENAKRQRQDSSDEGEGPSPSPIDETMQEQMPDADGSLPDGDNEDGFGLFDFAEMRRDSEQMAARLAADTARFEANAARLEVIATRTKTMTADTDQLSEEMQALRARFEALEAYDKQREESTLSQLLFNAWIDLAMMIAKAFRPEYLCDPTTERLQELAATATDEQLESLRVPKGTWCSLRRIRNVLRSVLYLGLTVTDLLLDTTPRD